MVLERRLIGDPRDQARLNRGVKEYNLKNYSIGVIAIIWMLTIALSRCSGGTHGSQSPPPPPPPPHIDGTHITDEMEAKMQRFAIANMVIGACSFAMILFIVFFAAILGEKFMTNINRARSDLSSIHSWQRDHRARLEAIEIKIEGLNSKSE